MKITKNIAIGVMVLLFASFTDEPSVSWNIHLKNYKKTKDSNIKTFDVPKNVTIFFKKTDVLTLSETVKYAGNNDVKRVLLLVPANGVAVFSKELKNTEINSFDIDLNDVFKNPDAKTINILDIVEIDNTDNDSKSHKIKTIKFD